MIPARDGVSGSRFRFFYGWVIVAVCAITLLVVFGIRLSFTVYFVALTDEFQWPRASTAFIFSTTMIVFALVSTPAGLALDRFGARRTFGAGAALLALGLFLSSQVQSYWQLAFSYGVVAGLGITILGLGVQAGLIARWFRRKLGMALGLAFAGTGLGAFILTPTTERLISSVGWRFSYLFMAGLALLLIPLTVIFLRLTPASMGLRPDGDLAPENSSADAPADDAAGEPAGGWTLERAARTPAFWLVIVASLGAIGPLRMLTVHQLAVVVDAGFDSLYAATVIGFSGAVTAVAFVLFGARSDRIGRRAAYGIGSVCLVGAIVLLSGMRDARAAGWLVLYALLLGLGEGSRSSLVTAVASDLFPGRSLGAINGAVGAAFGLSAAFFPWFAGRLFDQSGVYSSAFAAAGLAVFISTVALWLAPAAAKKHSSPVPG
ncbi:MAG: MFS transporter [Chloroflexota bacterium]|nr:MAG: MFS transporter [Chloroflexota bacterium]